MLRSLKICLDIGKVWKQKLKITTTQAKNRNSEQPAIRCEVQVSNPWIQSRFNHTATHICIVDAKSENKIKIRPFPTSIFTHGSKWWSKPLEIQNGCCCCVVFFLLFLLFFPILSSFHCSIANVSNIEALEMHFDRFVHCICARERTRVKILNTLLNSSFDANDFQWIFAFITQTPDIQMI